MTKTLTIRCKPFSRSPRGDHRIMISDGAVLVYDDVAGYYTRCHALSARTQRRIMKAARA